MSIFNQSKLNAATHAHIQNNMEKFYNINQAEKTKWLELLPAGHKAPSPRIYDEYETSISTRTKVVLKKECVIPNGSFWTGVPDVGRFMRGNGITSRSDTMKAENKVFRFHEPSILLPHEYKITRIAEAKTPINPEGKPTFKVDVKIDVGVVSEHKGIECTVYLRPNIDLRLPDGLLEGIARFKGHDGSFRVCVNEYASGRREIIGQYMGYENDDYTNYVFHGKLSRNISGDIVWPQLPLGDTYKTFLSMEDMQQWFELISDHNNYDDSETKSTFDKEDLLWTNTYTRCDTKRYPNKVVREEEDVEEVHIGVVTMIPHDSPIGTTNVIKYIEHMFCEEEKANKKAMARAVFAALKPHQ